MVKGDAESAKTMYLLAKDAYSKLGLEEEVKLIDDMLNGMDKQAASASSGEKNEKN